MVVSQSTQSSLHHTRQLTITVRLQLMITDAAAGWLALTSVAGDLAEEQPVLSTSVACYIDKPLPVDAQWAANSQRIAHHDAARRSRSLSSNNVGVMHMSPEHA